MSCAEQLKNNNNDQVSVAKGGADNAPRSASLEATASMQSASKDSNLWLGNKTETNTSALDTQPNHLFHDASVPQGLRDILSGAGSSSSASTDHTMSADTPIKNFVNDAKLFAQDAHAFVGDAQSYLKNYDSMNDTERAFGRVGLMEDKLLLDTDKLILNIDAKELSLTGYGGTEHPATTNGDGHAPTTTNGDGHAPTTTNSDAHAPATTNGDAHAPATTNGDAHAPATTNGDAQAPATTNGDAQAPATTNGDAQAPATTNGDVQTPASTTGDVQTPTTPGKDVSPPTQAGTDQIPTSPKANPLAGAGGAMTVGVDGFVGPDGKPWSMKGLNGGVDDALQHFDGIQQQFPGLTAIRLNVVPNQDSAGKIDEVVKKYTDAGIAVELEDHSGDGRNVDWYSQMAQTYKNNPLVMLETPNEPKGDVANDQIAVINAIRATGYNNPIGLQPIGGYDQSNVDTVLNAVGGPSQIFLTPHIYYSGTDPNGAADYVNSEVSGAKQRGMFASIDEFGPAMDGFTRDPQGGTVDAAVVAASKSGQAGAVYWAMNNGNHDDADSAFADVSGSNLTSEGRLLQQEWLA